MKLNVLFLSLCVGNVFGESPTKKYIVTLKSSASFLPKTTSLLDRYFRFILGYEEGFGVMDTFQHAIDGFLATIPESMVSSLQALPFVENIEEDADIQMYTEQKDAPWGLARMSQRGKLPSYGPFNYRYADNGGEGVAVYVIDSGVRITHEEFEGRAVIGKTFVSDNDNDENGHGTHVSATIAGKTYGVAKKAQIVALKVFDSAGKGKRSNILQAMEFAMNDKRGKKGNVINMSLGSLFSFSVNLAVRAAYMNGIAVVVAAGNSGMDSIMFSPSSSPVAITVGASTINDTMASFSNSGMMVDIMAPGENILSAWNGTDTDQKVISGTSMACPHISGLAAYLMSKQGLDNAQVKSKIVSLSTPDVVSGMKLLTPNRLAYNGFGY